MAIRLVEANVATLNEHLALDEALLLAAEAGGDECLRFWEWPTLAVVLGAGGALARDVDEAACQADGVPIHRRASGGGTVLLGRGCLLYSLVLAYDRAPELRDVNASYRWILGRIRAALAPIANLEVAGISDLARDGRKVSGNAQQRKSRHVLHHGSLLYDFDLTQFARYLRAPEREPHYRAARDHDAFTTNLPATAALVRELLTAAFVAFPGAIDAKALAKVDDLIAERYGREDWVRRR